jgi:hypothetical protein
MKTTGSEVEPVLFESVAATKWIELRTLPALYCALEMGLAGEKWGSSGVLWKRKGGMRNDSGTGVETGWTYIYSVRDPYWHRERYKRVAPMDLRASHYY